MSKGIWVLLITTYLCVLIVTAPSSVLSPVIKSASKGRVELANTEGTIWDGAANPILHQHGGGIITLTRLHWKISTQTLFTGKLSAQVKWDDEPQAVPMDIIASLGKVEVHHAYFPLSAILLGEASKFLKPAGLRGKVILRSDSLLISQQGLQGLATADWLDASSLLSSVSPLGNYHFTFSASNGGVDITLNTMTGALILAGKGRLSASSGLNFKGTAQASKEKEEALRELLNNLGPEISPGIKSFTLVP
ncbi:MAG: type II secretion system protein N [Gallionellaceae bacterium]